MVQPQELFGGESAYCFNKSQLDRAYELAERDQESSAKIKEFLALAQERLNRNERAALAFVLIDSLLGAKK